MIVFIFYSQRFVKALKRAILFTNFRCKDTTFFPFPQEASKKDCKKDVTTIAATPHQNTCKPFATAGFGW